MYFSRLTIPTGTDLFLFLRESFHMNLYHDHQLVWKLFPQRPEASRDFLFREEQKNKHLCYYLVSRRKPEALIGLEIQTKIYSPQIEAGDSYSFSLRANPVITRKSAERKNSVQHDVLMDAKRNSTNLNLSEIDRLDFIKKRTIEWLRLKSEKNGFSFDSSEVTFDQYRQHTLYKKNEQQIKFSTVDFFGILKVENKVNFREALFNGIGKKRAFGCGLLLIKPIQR
jgi:CRISPR system Cascade subunit CasE